jgi:hypothetical protein
LEWLGDVVVRNEVPVHHEIQDNTVVVHACLFDIDGSSMGDQGFLEPFGNFVLTIVLFPFIYHDDILGESVDELGAIFLMDGFNGCGDR